MLVNCFVVNFFYGNCKEKNMKELHKLFGENIPQYLQYEGGKGCNYLCCVDAIIDVIQICKDYGVEITKPSLLEIDDTKYNNQYQIHPTYTKDPPHFVLEKIKVTNFLLQVKEGASVGKLSREVGERR